MDTLSKTVAAIDSEQQRPSFSLRWSWARQRGSSPCTLRFDKISICRIEGGDTDQLMALIEQKRVQAAQRLGRAGAGRLLPRGGP